MRREKHWSFISLVERQMRGEEMRDTVTDTLARHVAEASAHRMPESALVAARRVMLDATGVMLGASGLAAEAQPFVDLARSQGKGPATILGTPYTAPATAAALANGAFAHALDFEDAFELSPGHPNASLVPALLALAQTQGPVEGRRFLTALAVGGDMACRLALALDQPMEQGGWYPPPILAGFGAVAGCANLLQLDAEAVRDAFSLMLCQVTMPGEIKYSAGTRIRAVREAFPAQAAVQSCLLAKAGVTGFEQPLEGRAGFYALYANGNFDPNRLTAGLGCKFWIEDLTFKPWPSCRGTHAFIEMALALREEHGFTAADLAEVDVRIDPVHTMLFEPQDIRRKPSNAIEAKFSIPFCLALALVRGRVSLDDFRDEDLADPQVLEVATRISPIQGSDHEWQRGRGGALSLKLVSGQVLGAQIEHSLGSPEKPLSEEQLVDKFVMCVVKASSPLPEEEGRALATRILALDECEDVGALFPPR
ncbi:MmgE/PrpD family protein [Aurantiacibacter poecillastricola]|uniref:MmgE/PrpD family protein n=1 Tax=Aurantiacibacter poecillastricola TaxID=3064385 RepID=UPI00273F4D49|nr:MmgE/PrpD family protein [Aurantiacibacter sp. 219JJ12-13]MDP5261293.1 MmgE/PrpD family protein [Aurantiacibacter sp. 219JJ12-13]